MIKLNRSLSGLNAITKSRDRQNHISQYKESYSSKVESVQRKRYLNSLDEREVALHDLPKTMHSKSMQNKKSISRFTEDFHNNRIQSYNDPTLIERNNKQYQQYVAK